MPNFFYKTNFIRTLDSFLLKIHKQIKNKANSDLKKKSKNTSEYNANVRKQQILSHELQRLLPELRAVWSDTCSSFVTEIYQRY